MVRWAQKCSRCFWPRKNASPWKKKRMRHQPQENSGECQKVQNVYSKTQNRRPETTCWRLKVPFRVNTIVPCEHEHCGRNANTCTYTGFFSHSSGSLIVVRRLISQRKKPGPSAAFCNDDDYKLAVFVFILVVQQAIFAMLVALWLKPLLCWS